MWVLIAFLLLLVRFSYAQKDTLSHQLAEVVVYGSSISEYMAGVSVQKVSTKESGSSLADVIGSQISVIFKSYGNGQLASISMRGTSASHTNLIWNGIPVGSATLGQSDFSVYPTFLIDNLSLLKGCASSTLGSGNIGGSIIVDNNNWIRDSTLTVYSKIGSFGRYEGGIKFNTFIGDKLLMKTSLFSSDLKNNFPVQIGDKTEEQQHAAVRSSGMSQKFLVDLGNHQPFVEIAFNRNHRQIQPAISVSSRDYLELIQVRGVVADNYEKNKFSAHFSLGGIKEKYIYNTSSITRSGRFSSVASLSYQFNSKLQSKIGTNFIHSFGENRSYKGEKSLSQIHFFNSWNFQPSSNIRFSLNLRESLHGKTAVFTPSFGAECTTEGGNNYFKLKTQLSSGYRVPTFNDRFWQPGGNPNLRPESSKSAELGFETGFLKGNTLFSIATTVYMMNVHDWILWQPTEQGFWRPQNFTNVFVRGLETTANWKQSFNQIKTEWNFSYEYTNTYDASDTTQTHIQLPYIPFHSFSTNLKLEFPKAYQLDIRGNYTGKRYINTTNLEEDTLAKYWLFDLFISKQFHAFSGSQKLRLGVLNILDKEYHTIDNMAMPGRNYSCEIIFKF